MKKSVLITGASGFIGRYILAATADWSSAITTLGRRRVSAAAHHIEADLSRNDTIEAPSVDVVVHAAGMAHATVENRAETELFRAVNVDGTRRLLAAIDRAGGAPPAVVLLSTVAVYGLARGENVTEEQPRRATDAYGCSKAGAEDIVVEWGRTTHAPVVILRLPLVAGNNPPGNLGAMARAIRAGYYVGIGAGNARRSWVWAADVAMCIKHIAGRSGTYHVTDGEHPSLQMIERHLHLLHGKPEPRRLPTVVARVLAAIGDAVGTVGIRGVPLSSRRLDRLINTLTFSDCKAREDLHWRPRVITEHIRDVFACDPGGAHKGTLS